MRTISSATPPHTLRPLVRGLLLALAALPLGSALAGDLDGQNKQLSAADPVEAWTLINGSTLSGNNASTHQISASDTSTITLYGGTVTRVGTTGQRSVELSGDAQLTANGTQFRGGGIALAGGNTAAHLTGGSIIVAAADLRPTEALSVGVDLFAPPTGIGAASPRATIDNTTIYVEDAPAGSRDVSNGVGVRMQFGQMDIVNGSRVDASNIGAVLWGASNPDERMRLNIDNSTITSGRGAAIWVNAGAGVDNTYDITVANGAQLFGGDGNLLLVGRDTGVVSTRNDVNFNVDNARLAGNVTYDPTNAPTAQVNVFLRNKAQIDGRFNNVTTASIDGDSTWLLTGDSNVGALTLGATGTVALGNGSTFNTLNVDTFTGNGGTVLFNTQLGDDTSATDHLWVQGDTSGHGTIMVSNLGGRGGQTVDGIELIQIDGVSGAALSLTGRAVGGQYEYFLFKGSHSDPTDGNWYLRSELQPVVDPCDADPTAAGCGDPDPKPDPTPDPTPDPEPVLRPEPGAYLGNQRSALQMFTLPAQALKGRSGLGARGAWAAVASSNARYGAVADQLRVRGDTSSLQIGADLFSWGDRGALGVLLGSGRARATSSSHLTGYSASGTVDGKAVGVYGQWRQSADDDRGLSLDGVVQHARFDNTVQGEGLGKERYNSRSTSAAIEAGYALTLIDNPVRSVYVQPQVQLRYTDFNADVHTESNGTVIDGADASGLSSRVGVRVYGHAKTTDRNRVQPFVAVNWIRESAHNSLRFDGEHVLGGLPRDRVEAAAGVQLRLGSRWSAWGDMGWQRGDGGYREVGATLGLRASW